MTLPDFPDIPAGLAGGLSQVALQRSRRNSYLYTMEIATYSIVSLATLILVYPAVGMEERRRCWVGWSNTGGDGSGNGGGRGGGRREGFDKDREAMLARGVFGGWTRLTSIPVFTNAMGGIFVGQVESDGAGGRGRGEGASDREWGATRLCVGVGGKGL
eukprot:748923-Hanusia_phi.AAC.3